MKINELMEKTGDIELTVEVTEVSDIKEFEKAGSKGRVAKATIKDETGECKLTLWNEQIEEVKAGSKIKIIKGWADSWQGEMQVSTGKFGTLEVLESNTTLTQKEPEKNDDDKNKINHLEENIYSEDDEVVFDDDEDII